MTAIKKNYNLKKSVLFIISFLLISIAGLAQARWQADVSITSVNIVPAIRKARPQEIVKTPETKTSDNLKCTITVHNENDDDARGTMLLVVLPVEVSVVSLPSNATLPSSVTTSQPFAGYILFNLGQMAVQQNITLEFTFTKSKYGNKVGAYAYSESPDPNPANNYKDATY